MVQTRPMGRRADRPIGGDVVIMDLLTTREVAAILKRDVKTVRALVRVGKLRRVVVGERGVRFREEDVQEYLKGLGPCPSSAGAVSGITSSGSKVFAIAGPPSKRRKPSPENSNTPSVLEFPWET